MRRSILFRADEMLNDYYNIRGWDEEGRPGSKFLKTLELESRDGKNKD